MKIALVMAIGIMAGSLAAQVTVQVLTPQARDFVGVMRVAVYAWIFFKLVDLQGRLAK